MYKKRYNFSVTEYFATQRLAELTFYGTLDSYRIRLNNPKTTITELCQVMLDWHDNKIKDFKTVKYVIEELLKLLNSDKELVFSKTTKNSYIKLLNDCKDNSYLHVLYSSRIILSENVDYIDRLFKNIDIEVARLNQLNKIESLDYSECDRLLGFMTTELSSWGYSKSFLFHLIKSLFIVPSVHSFEDSFKMFKRVVQKRTPSTFKVYLKAKFSNIQMELLYRSIPELMKEDEIQNILSSAPKEFTTFYNDSSKQFPDIFLIKVQSLDYYDAVKQARARVSEILDIVKLGYTERSLKLFKNAILISESDPNRIERQKIFYQIDGRVQTSPELYEKFLNKFLTIRENPNISTETKSKIKSAIRYFRLGTESIEIEQKFINYWIGIEYLFSSYDADASTFQRFRNYFSKIHSLAYLKRNLLEFHNDLIQYELIESLPNFTSIENIDYLIELETYDYIISTYYELQPLIAFKAKKFKVILSNEKDFKDYISNHIKNIEGHLARTYRIRNEIVHEAAIKPNIENLTSNLRYYLIFTITTLLDFFENPAKELNINGQISIDDFFISKSLDFENYTNNKNNQKTLFDNEHTENIIY